MNFYKGVVNGLGMTLLMAFLVSMMFLEDWIDQQDFAQIETPVKMINATGDKPPVKWEDDPEEALDAILTMKNPVSHGGNYVATFPDNPGYTFSFLDTNNSIVIEVNKNSFTAYGKTINPDNTEEIYDAFIKFMNKNGCMKGEG